MPRRLDWALLQQALVVDKPHPSVLRQLVGAGLQSESLKGVHVMNQVLQALAGGAAPGRGDHLCRIVRQDHLDEDNRDSTLRDELPIYRRAYPPELGGRRVRQLRTAAAAVLTHDGGVYRAGDRMCSSLGTHVRLQGAEQLFRFDAGGLVLQLIGERARDRLSEVLADDTDPISVAFRPLFAPGVMVEQEVSDIQLDRRELDERLGERLALLLEQPLAKPALLRLFVQAALLGLLLRTHGLGSPAGRPTLLGVLSNRSPLRPVAQATTRRCISALDDALAVELARHPLAAALWSSPRSGGPALTVGDHPSLTAASGEIIRAARAHTPKRKRVIWPEQSVGALARRCGFWVRWRSSPTPMLQLTPDLVEALVLMYVPDGETMAWDALWSSVSSELGLYAGVGAFQTMRTLAEVGVQVSVDPLRQQSLELLELAVRRGVARRLPDGGAEAGGICADLP